MRLKSNIKTMWIWRGKGNKHHIHSQNTVIELKVSLFQLLISMYKEGCQTSLFPNLFLLYSEQMMRHREVTMDSSF